MILPIVVYGNPILRRKASAVDLDRQELDVLISSMFDTMYNANGVGLAAPQIGRSVRLFITDIYPQDQTTEKTPRVFINATILDETGSDVPTSEGCLSIPNVREDVTRKDTVRLEYYDRDMNKHVELFEGFQARVIQHEYDHIEGKLLIDRISPFKRKMLAGKLKDIAKGKFFIKNNNIKYKQ
jgi:peptide deformylase